MTQLSLDQDEDVETISIHDDGKYSNPTESPTVTPLECHEPTPEDHSNLSSDDVESGQSPVVVNTYLPEDITSSDQWGSFDETVAQEMSYGGPQSYNRGT